MSDFLETGAGARHKRQQLPEEVAAYVRGLIISGAVQPGDFLRMEPIAEAVGVSNTPVREGLLSLRGEGFVQLVPRRGFVVAPFAQQDIHDLFWAQAQLAGELAARAAANMTPEQMGRLLEVHAAHEKAMADGDMEAYSDLGHEFHAEINRAADSHRLAALLNMIVKQLPSRFYVGIQGHAEATGNKHRRLIDALHEGDAESARTIMEQHVMEGARYLIESLEEQGVFTRDDDKSADAKTAAPTS